MKTKSAIMTELTKFHELIRAGISDMAMTQEYLALIKDLETHYSIYVEPFAQDLIFREVPDEETQ